MCEGWVGDWTDCNILTPSSSVFSSTSFSFCWAAQPGLQLVLTTASYLQLTEPVCGTVLYNCLTSTCFLWASHLHPIQPVHSQGYTLISSTGCTCYLHRCISYLTARPRVNMHARAHKSQTIRHLKATSHYLLKTTICWKLLLGTVIYKRVSGRLTWGIYSATSDCFDLVGWCCRVTLLVRPMIQLLVWPLFGLSICSRLQTPAPEKTTCGKKNDWLKNRPFFTTESFLGIYARSLCADAMIFSVWHWPLLGQHPVAVIFFCSVDVCRSVF